MQSGLGIILAAHTIDLPACRKDAWAFPSYYAVRQRTGLREHSPRLPHSLVTRPISGYSSRAPTADRPRAARWRERRGTSWAHETEETRNSESTAELNLIILFFKVAAIAAELAFPVLKEGGISPSQLDVLFTKVQKHEEKCYAHIDEVCIHVLKFFQKGKTCG